MPEVKSVVEEEPGAEAEEDDEVMDWLQDLAAKQAEALDEEEFKAASPVEATAPVLEDRDIPDAPEEGLEWLEQLADQRGIDVDVSVPGQATPPPSSTESEPEPEAGPESDTAPGWLGRMATQPIPKVDMEALEAAAQGEGVSPDAETIDTKAAEVQAQLEEAALESDSAEADSDDATIESHASDLQPEIEVERVAAPSDPAPRPTNTTADADASALEPEIEEDATQEASLSEEISGVAESDASTGDAEVAEPDWIQASDVSAEDSEPAEPIAIAADEGPEVEEPEAEAELIAEEPPAPEAKKKEDLLERSRQALASGDTASAAEMYSDMIKRKKSLESVIEDLRIAVDRAPDNADLWQVLGDAYMRDDQTDEAIDAYRKGMEAA